MHLSQDAALRAYLLDCLASPVGTLPVAPVLGAEAWRAWLKLVTMHRVGPLLHWKQSQAGDPGWPDFLSQALAAVRRTHALRAMQMQRELLHAHRLLTAAGIPCMALKGAFLAWHAYPGPDLRPVRDLDLLVPADQALRAYAVLRAGGYQQLSGVHGELDVILETSKHLPGLRRPGSGVTLELHAQLFHPDENGGQAHELSRLPGFWERAMRCELAGELIRYPAPTDQLLHLLVHAVADHKLNNGPLIFTDIHYLLKAHDIDWPLFWRQADRLRQLPAVALGLCLAEHHGGDLGIGWPAQRPALPDGALLDALRLFSLRDFDARKDILVTQHFQGGWLHWLSWLRRKVLPDPRSLASRYPTGNRLWTLPYWYGRSWLDGLRRLAGILRGRHKVAIRNELDTLQQLDSWLLRAAAAPARPDPGRS